MRSWLIFTALILSTSIAEARVTDKKQLDETLKTLSESKEAEVELKKKLEATKRDMQAMRERAASIGEALQSSERRVSSQESALAAVNKDLAEKRKAFEARKEEYARTVLSLLRMRNLPPTAMFAPGADTEQLLRAASVLGKTNQAVAQKATQLRADIAQLRRLQTNAKLRETTTRSEKLKLKSEQQTLALELEKRQKLQAKLNADHARAEERVAQLSRESNSLQELIGKLTEQEKTPPPSATTGNFVDKKGSLRSPVMGEVIHRFGEKQPGNGTYRGMVFRARPGATVVAPYDGQIAFTGPFRDYGNMVLIKHKNGYISLIAGLGKISADLNQDAIRGEPIGTMPESGKSEAYVELRDKDAKPIDPASWFANVVSNTAQN